MKEPEAGRGSALASLPGARRLYAATSRGVGALVSVLRHPYSRVYYVVDGVGWSIDWDGRYITRGVEQAHGVPARTTTNYHTLRRQVVHFGTRSSYLLRAQDEVHPSNRLVVTWFHGGRDDPDPQNQLMIRRMEEGWRRISTVVTSSSLVRARLASWGVAEERLVTVPLGVDRTVFRPPTEIERSAARARLGIPPRAFVIGSFQKDGEGWAEGLEPKRVKGPDVWLDVVRDVHRDHPVFCLLSGPARGFVRAGLESAGIPYLHHVVDDYRDLATYYHALDAYLVASRDEGGPKAIPESLATATPLVSTRVGMAPDHLRDGENALLAEVEDRRTLVSQVRRLAEDPTMGQRLAEAGLRTARGLGWDSVAERYWREVYRPLLGGRGGT